MHLNRFILCVTFGTMLIGCSITPQRDYVLREPLTVRLAGDGQRSGSVVLPAGTRVRETFQKSGICFIEVYGEVGAAELRDAGELQREK